MHRCMKRIESTADTLWSTDLSRDMHSVLNPHPEKGDNSIASPKGSEKVQERKQPRATRAKVQAKAQEERPRHKPQT